MIEKLMKLVPKWVDPIINKALTWHYTRRYKKAKYALEILLVQKDPTLYKDLAVAAQAIARQLCMNWLDGRRVNHCYVCPNTDSLIRRNEGGYICAEHTKVGVAIPFGAKPQEKPGIIKLGIG